MDDTPKYTPEAAGPPSLADDVPPPPYEDYVPEASSSRSKPSIPVIGKNEGYPNAPYRPFPSIINAHGTYSLKGLYTFFLCGATKDDRLYLVETHGRSGISKPPLGLRMGGLLHNGLTTHDPIVAATSDNDAGEHRYELDLLKTSSVIFVPDGKGGLKTEVMEGVITPDKEVAFRFSMDVEGQGATRRETFEWVKFKKGEDSEHPGAGYKLFGLAASEPAPGVTGPSNPRPDTVGHRNGDALAVVTFPSGLMTFKISYFFTLEFLKAADIQSVLGEEWKLTVVMSAVRLIYLRAKGSTNKSVVSHYAKKT